MCAVPLVESGHLPLKRLCSWFVERAIVGSKGTHSQLGFSDLETAEIPTKERKTKQGQNLPYCTDWPSIGQQVLERELR